VDNDQPELRKRSGISESGSTASLTKQDELAKEEGEGESVTLKRKVGLISGISLIVGTMIGECYCRMGNVWPPEIKIMSLL
jgi:hypothetical protein